MRGWGTYCNVSGSNLPEYKKDNNVGNSWAPCPWSTQSDDQRSIDMLGILPGNRNDHTGENGKIYYMKPFSKGPIWGYECTFDNCPYYIAYSERYFYV